MEMQFFILGHVILLAICICSAVFGDDGEESLDMLLIYGLFFFFVFEIIYWILHWFLVT